MRRIILGFAVTFVLGLGSALVMAQGHDDCDGCTGTKGIRAMNCNSNCSGEASVAIDCSPCCSGTTCYHKDGYDIN